jgi:hypothetical protein
VIIEPCRVSVPLIGVRDPGGAVWSRRRFISPVFGEVLIFPSLCEYLVLVVAFTVLPLAFKYWSPRHLNHTSLRLQVLSHLPAEREEVGEKSSGDCVVPVGCSFRGLLWRPEPTMPFQQLVLEGSLQVGKDRGGAQANHRVL